MGRRKEAQILQRFLIAEAERGATAAVPKSYVLAIDAPYGQGKSWFLSKFREQVALKYPVAFVDAWADDTGNEPLVALMSAVDETLQPFFNRPEFKAKVAGVLASMGTVLMKGVSGAFGKAAGKYLGDEFADQASDEMRKQIEEAVAKGTEDAVSSIQGITDKFAQKSIEQYRSRKKSVETFKLSLAKTIEAIGADEFSPIFIIIDELDRCRPTYAISILEEIKHVFDVPGVVFVIAMHGDQLAHSVNAVYGEEFDSAAYLRRFFSRKYRLVDLGLGGIVIEQFARLGIAETKFDFPMSWLPSAPGQLSVVDGATKILEFYGVNAREAIAVLESLKIWDILWEEPFQMDLVWALVHILSSSRGVPNLDFKELSTVNSGFSFYFGSGEMLDPSEYTKLIESHVKLSLTEIGRQRALNGSEIYLRDMFLEELRARFPSRSYPEGAMSKLADAKQLTEMVGRFEEGPSEDPQIPPSA